MLNNVAWALYNGNVHEMGWFGRGCTNCYISDTDVIHAEWSYNNQTKIGSLYGRLFGDAMYEDISDNEITNKFEKAQLSYQVFSVPETETKV